jgi:hypothetical protein
MEIIMGKEVGDVEMEPILYGIYSSLAHITGI